MSSNEGEKNSFRTPLSVTTAASSAVQHTLSAEELAEILATEGGNKNRFERLHALVTQSQKKDGTLFVEYLTLRIDPSFFSITDDLKALREAHDTLEELHGSYRDEREQGYQFQDDVLQHCQYLLNTFPQRDMPQLYAQDDFESWLGTSRTLARNCLAIRAQFKQLPKAASQQEKEMLAKSYKHLSQRQTSLNAFICDKFHLSAEGVNDLLTIEGGEQLQAAITLAYDNYLFEALGKLLSTFSKCFEAKKREFDNTQALLRTLDGMVKDKAADYVALMEPAMALFEAHHRVKCFVKNVCSNPSVASDVDQNSFMGAGEAKIIELQQADHFLLDGFSPESVFEEGSTSGSLTFSDSVKKLLSYSLSSYHLFMDDKFDYIHQARQDIDEGIREGASLDSLYGVLDGLEGYSSYALAQQFLQLLSELFTQLEEVNKKLPESCMLLEDSFSSSAAPGSRRDTGSSAASFSSTFAGHSDPLDQCQRFDVPFGAGGGADVDALDLSALPPSGEDDQAQLERLKGLNEDLQRQKDEVTAQVDALSQQLAELQPKEVTVDAPDDSGKKQAFTLATPGRITLAVSAGLSIAFAAAGIALLETIETALPVAQLFVANPAVPILIGLLVLSLLACAVGVGRTCWENGKRLPSQGASVFSGAGQGGGNGVGFDKRVAV